VRRWRLATAALKAGGLQPALSIIVVGGVPASQVYTRHTVNDSAETGLAATLERYPATMAQDELLARIRALNADAGGSRHPGATASAPAPGFARA